MIEDNVLFNIVLYEISSIMVYYYNYIKWIYMDIKNEFMGALKFNKNWKLKIKIYSYK